MQTPLTKRNLGIIADEDNLELGDAASYKEPRKKIKTSLMIDIPDPFTEIQNNPMLTTTRPKSAPYAFVSPRTPRSCKSSTSTPPLFAGSSTPKSFDFNDLLYKANTDYDDYYKEDSFFNATMKKCHRKYMEDRAHFEKGYDKQNSKAFFGIYDGHRNSYTADFLQKNLYKNIVEHPLLDSDPKEALTQTFENIDKSICKNQERMNIQGGSTALCALMDKQKILLANVGDSKAALLRDNGELISLTKEHIAQDEDEKKLVESKGGFVFEKNVCSQKRFLVQGALEVTRSLGDRNYKKYISNAPDIVDHNFQQGDKLVILASDGFWKEIDESKIPEIVAQHGKLEGLSQVLVEEATKGKEYSVDNITLIVIDIASYINALNQPEY